MTLLDYRKALFTADEFDRMAEIGAFGRRKVVLIEGEIVEMHAQGEEHVAAFTLATIVFNRVFGTGWAVRFSSPLRVDAKSQPEPDVVVVRGDPREIARRGERPTRAELVVEISDSTLRDDRKKMKELYARTGTPEYWIINLPDRQLEVHRNPDSDAKTYRDVQIIPPGARIAPLASPTSTIDPADLLP